jgi:hypothetical protein
MTKKAYAKDYDKIGHELGFNPAGHFVKITSRNRISFTCGKPDEIFALYRAVRDNNYIASKALVDAVDKL